MTVRNPQRGLKIQMRRQKVAEMYLSGDSQQVIAERLGVAQSTISLDIKAIHQAWKESAVRDFDEARGAELARIDKLEREAWQAWQESKEPQHSTKVVTDGNGKKAEKTTKHTPGDARFLELIHKCIASRRALLGLDAPTRIAATSPDGDEAYHSHVMKELIKLAEQAKDGPEIVDSDYIDNCLRELVIEPKKE